MENAAILILDYGSQYTQLITRAVREQSVYSLQLPWNTSESEIKEIQPKGIILSGGPDSIYSPGAPGISPSLLSMGVPILGICYGMQAMAGALEGEINPSAAGEYGPALLEVSNDNPLLPAGKHRVWMSHGDQITHIPPGFSLLASTSNTPIAAMGNQERQFYGVQFHPEVKHTAIGKEVIGNFLFKICQLTPSWTAGSIIENSLGQIRETVGNDRVITAVSGGVDSTVAAALVQRAVGSQLDAVFVDTGLLRKDEALTVQSALRAALSSNLHTVQAAEIFFKDLAGVTDPEEKRVRIGNRFIRIFEEQALRLAEPRFLVQGTIYPDVVESAAPDRNAADMIKTHHNVGGLPESMNFQLIEPLRFLFKDEVRKIGLELGLPDELIWRQPFPGPGLAIRCLGEVTKERIEILQEADAIFIDELREANLLRYQRGQSGSGSSQAFAVLLPIKTVGVMGDQRTYENVLALRAVTTDDFMTADWSRLPADLLAAIANRIVNEVAGVNRVVYDITSKPPATIEWE
ncbi:MAG: glutamine-hydrolyzing GMP synthase [Anaerolineales bacterium]